MDTKRPKTAPLLINNRATPLGNKRFEGQLKIALNFSERRLLLGLSDLFLINGALLLTLLIRRQINLTPEETWRRLPWFLIWSGVWLAVGLLLDIYDLARAANPLHSIGSSIITIGLATGIYVFIPYITPPLPDGRAEALIFPGLVTAGIVCWRWSYAKFFVQVGFQRRVLIIGAGQAGRTLIQAISQSKPISGSSYEGTGYRVLGFIDDDPLKQNLEIEGVPVLGTSHQIEALVDTLHPDELVIAISHMNTIHKELFETILACQENGLTIASMPILYEQLTGRVPIEPATGILEVALPLNQSPTLRAYMFIRRLIDVVVGLAGCIFLVVIIPFVWLANQINSPGPLFYYQERIGKGGKNFSIIKFRSMVVNAEQRTGAVWATVGDSRITRLGLFLRKTRLDEIPQFWNILKGEMSLIGPRPERPIFVAKLIGELPLYRVRHAAKPGLTGWAQVKYRYGSSVEDSLIKLQYDLYYIKHQGVLLDLNILLKTIMVVLSFKGR